MCILQNRLKGDKLLFSSVEFTRMPGVCASLFLVKHSANFAACPKNSAFSAEILCVNFAVSPPFSFIPIRSVPTLDLLKWGRHATVLIVIIAFK